MRWFFRVSVVVFLVALGFAAWAFPERVPVHFDATGRADRYEDKEFALLSLGGIGIGLAVLFWLLVRFFPRGSLRSLNVPHRAYWMRQENRGRLRRMLADDLAFIGGATMLLMAGMLALTAVVADDPRPSLGVAGGLMLGLFLVTVIGYVILMYTSRYRPPDDSSGG